MTEQARILSKTFEQNIDKAQSCCEDLFNSLSAKGYKLYTIHLRAESISTFSALFIVDKTQYLSDEFREAFVFSRNFQESIINDDFHIIFMFMAHSKTINEDCLNADGYFLKYEKACEHLLVGQDLSDWVVTTAFYASLHFVSYKIFPFSIRGKEEGKSIKIENIDQYKNFHSNENLSRHHHLANLVAKYCPPIQPDYDRLLSLSMTARYDHYQTDRSVANMAVRLMRTIKKHCEN